MSGHPHTSSESVDVRFDHTILPAIDSRTSAEFFAEIFGLASPVQAGPFIQIRLSDGRLLDFADSPEGFPSLHFAFLVNDSTFDSILERLISMRVDYWAEPSLDRPGEYNTYYGGRGVYFRDPGGHYLEALTARYDGSQLT